MRMGPIGCLGWHQPTSSSMVSNCVLSSHLTHQAPLCKEACVALGCAIAASLRAKTTGADPVAAVLDALEEVCNLTDYRGMLAVCAFLLSSPLSPAPL